MEGKNYSRYLNKIFKGQCSNITSKKWTMKSRFPGFEDDDWGDEEMDEEFDI